MSDLRGLSAATSEKGSRSKHERLHRTAMPDLYLRGGRQDHAGYFEAILSTGDVQLAAIGRGGAGSGGHDCENHEGGGSVQPTRIKGRVRKRRRVELEGPENLRGVSWPLIPYN